MTITDAASAVETLLSSNWNSANTDSVTPTIDTIYDVKRVNTMTSTADVVLVYERVTLLDWYGLGWATRWKTTSITIDVRTHTSRSRAVKDLAEVDRIIRANKTSPISGYDVVSLGEPYSYTDLSDKRRNLWRYIYEVKFKSLSEAV